MHATFAEIFSASRRAMYACMGRVCRLGPVPVSLSVSLFNAYVRPVIMYCLDALPLTKKQEKQLDDLQLQYIRWCLGLAKGSVRVQALAETGQKPISMDIAKARVKYYLLLRSRPMEHITTAALHQMMETDKRPGSWYCSVRRDMAVFEFEGWHTAVQRDISLKSGKTDKAVVARSIGRACGQRWQRIGKGDLPHLPDWLLLDRPNFTLAPFMQTRVQQIHMYDHRSNRMFMCVCENKFSVRAPYLNVSMSKCVLRAFCQFRLGIAPLNAHDCRKKQMLVLARVCEFCLRVCGQQVVEDTYHVCVECPLYDVLRVRVFKQLNRHHFDFSNVHDLMCMYVCMLCVSDRLHVRAVGRFLADCLAVRDVFLGKPRTVWCTTSRLHEVQQCVDLAPTSCKFSHELLQQLAGACDVSVCASVSQHLNILQRACVQFM